MSAIAMNFIVDETLVMMITLQTFLLRLDYLKFIVNITSRSLVTCRVTNLVKVGFGEMRLNWNFHEISDVRFNLTSQG